MLCPCVLVPRRCIFPLYYLSLRLVLLLIYLLFLQKQKSAAPRDAVQAIRVPRQSGSRAHSRTLPFRHPFPRKITGWVETAGLSFMLLVVAASELGL